MSGLSGGAPRSAWRRWVAPYLARYARALVAALFLGVLSFAFAAALMFTSGYLISGSAEAETILALHLPLLLVRIFGIGKPVLHYFERLASHDWVLRMTSSMRLELYRAVSAADVLAGRAAQRTGAVLGLLSDDIGHLQNLYLRCVFPSVIAWILYAALVAALGAMDVRIASAMLLTVAVIVIAMPVASVAVNGARETRRKRLRADLYASLTDNVLGVADWAYAQRADEFTGRIAQATERLQRVERRQDRFARARLVVIEAAFALGIVALIVWAGSEFGSADGMPGGMANWIAAFALGLIPLADAFGSVSEAAEETFAHRDSLERLAALPDPGRAKGAAAAAAPGAEPPGADEASAGAPATARAAERPDIELRDMRFSYPGAETPVFDGLSLLIPAGQKVAVLGRSGVGKSTFASLVRGDLSPDAGTATVGGAPAASLGTDAVRLVGVVEQDPYLFRDTLLENVRLGRPDASETEVEGALRAVGLAERTAALPHGVNTMMDESGFGFSGGEAHRIALARVLVARCPVVILDEPCAGLDPATERALIDVFFEALSDRTVVMITHHLAGAERADRVVFFGDGGVKRDGSLPLDGAPDVLRRESAYYRTLLAFDEGRRR